MCLYPIPFRYVNFLGFDESCDLPCGKCVECLKNKQNDWKIRSIEESKNWKHGYFFTLTYAEDNLPYYLPEFKFVEDSFDNDFADTSLLLCRGKDVSDVHPFCKYSTVLSSDISLWLKRWRTNCYRMRSRDFGLSVSEIKNNKDYFKLKPAFSYFICSEYGPNGTHRPHYHGLLFTDMPRRYVASLFNDWRKNFGYVKISSLAYRNVGETNMASSAANYVSKYCCKGEFASRTLDIENGLCNPCFTLVSNGFGLSYIDRNKNYHLPHLKVNKPYAIDTIINRRHYYDGSFCYSLPRYYKERLFMEKIQRPKLVYNPRTRQADLRCYYRYAPHNSLCMQIKNRLRDKHYDAYRERFRILKSANPSLSDTEVHLLILRFEERDKKDREQKIKNNLNKFYFTNKLKNPEL